MGCHLSGVGNIKHVVVLWHLLHLSNTSSAAQQLTAVLLQVQAEGLETSVQELQSSLAEAHDDLSLKRQTVDGLTQKFDRQVYCPGSS